MTGRTPGRTTGPARSGRAPLRLLTVATVVGALGLLAACGNSDSSNSSSAAPATPSVVSSASATPSATPSASASPSASATPTIKASANTDAISVTGGYGVTPKVSFKTPFRIAKTQVRVLEPSDGPVVRDGTSVQVDYAGVDARTGKTFDSSFVSGRAPIAFPLSGVIQGFRTGLIGQHMGSRVLIAMTGPDGYDSSGGNAQAGINVGDTLIFVVDITTATLTEPYGDAVAAKDGLPTVSAGTGTPTVTIPKTTAPTSLVAQPIIKGNSQDKVAAGDTVTLHYAWYTWSDGKQIESDYGKAAEQVDLTKMISGFGQGLVGQTVGSRMLLVIPPSLSYPNGSTDPQISKTETQVFVVDILFTEPAATQ